MYEKYTNKQLSKLRNQHNIMVLVGNGFDMAVMKFLKSPVKTSYLDFYKFIKSKNNCNNDNEIIKIIDKKKISKDDNWCDFENAIGDLLVNYENYSNLDKHLIEIQNLFAVFLSEIVDNELISNLDDIIPKEKKAIYSLSRFLGDLSRDEGDLRFPQELNHYDLYNFLFVNFNYSMLLDNYIYLDRFQFVPHVHRTVDTNFSFYPNPYGFLQCNWDQNTVFSSYLLTDVIHPHGVYTIPRSILFGTDTILSDKNADYRGLIKNYWAQYGVRYSSYFGKTQLFIIYGMSITMNDAWWYDKIVDSIRNFGAELILYYYGNYTKEEVMDKWWSACIRHSGYDLADKKEIERNIHVVILHDNSNIFLGMPG